MTIFRENILDIVDNWMGYPLQAPCAGVPAQNAGTIELKCFINNTCPFNASPYKEDALVFNKATYDRIKPWLPDGLENALESTSGLDGIYFRPKKIFRHNYVYQKYSTDKNTVEQSAIDLNPVADLYDNFDDNYREVSKLPGGSSSSEPGVDQTRYKAEQTWVVVKSIFDPPCTDKTVPECDVQAKWAYHGQKVSDSEIKDEDLKLDYNKLYYNEYKSTVDKKGKLLPGKRAKINPFRAQMPIQTKVLSDQNAAVHWRLMKRTPLFKGEDFFIRFHKQAKDSIVDPNNANPGGDIEPFPSQFSQYFPLDVTRNDVLNMDSSISVDGLQRKRNHAISPPVIGNEKADSKKFDFHDQAYYIIELGVGSKDDRYFIILAERANPIFVNFVAATPQDNGSPAEVSKKLSEFKQIASSQLIQADYFDMTVRNHLGAIVIQFSGPGIDVDPWVIKRTDWVPDKDPVSGEFYLKDKVRLMFVPKGHMTVMGGNLRCGLIFGPLQYYTGYVSMIYPPREQFTNREKDMKLAFEWGSPEEITSRTIRSSGSAFKSSPFFLPSQGKHDLLFSSTDIFLQDLYKHTIPVGEAAFNQPLFMQDAQFYKNYYESSSSRQSQRYRDGVYLYDEVLKDYSSSSLEGARTSNIVVKKYRYMNDPKTRQQAFDVLIGMMCGDHVFTYGEWNAAVTKPTKEQRDFTDAYSMDINDQFWFLRSCKTPIITSLRLISNESDVPRWDDGTTKNSGVNSTPLEGISPYFIDASDHVMSYSDSWSASGLYEMEHTGSINFYLNRGMPVENNVTDALMSLQNKTFYVEIWAGYNRPCPDGGFASYSRQNDMFKLFTGLCQGGSISYEYGKTIMSCKVEDYTAVLKGTRFFNSPWFDGVKDINCINEILQMAGFRDRGKYDPGNLVRFLSRNSASRNPGTFFHHFDGRLFKMEAYALPSGYNRLDQPAFKFNDAEPYIDAVSKIAKRAGKVFFFDQFGIAHYENFQDIIQDDYLGRTPISPLVAFTTNPEVWPGQLIFNKMDRSYDVGGIINHIKIMSNTPDFYLLIGDDLNWSSMDDPASEGFVGYLKSMYQQESMFGSKEAMMDTINKYSVSFRPKIKAKFETYGVPLRANDIIQVNGENTRVLKVSHTITAEKNEWWMEVETEKYQIVNASRSVG